MKKFIKAFASAMAVITAASSLVCADTAVFSAATLKAPTSVMAKVFTEEDKDFFYGENSGIKITWKKSAGAKKYTVYRAKVSGSKTGKFKSIKNLKKTSYKDWEAKSGTYYKYKVAAVNGNQKAVSKATKKIAFLEVPRNEIILNKKYNGFTVQWEAVSGAKKYSIYRSTEGGKYKLIKSAAFKKTKNNYDSGLVSDYRCSYNDTDVKKGKQYTYYIVAVNGKLKSKAVKNGTPTVFNDYNIQIQSGSEKNALSDLLSVYALMNNSMFSSTKVEVTSEDESVLDVFQYSEDGVQKVEVTGVSNGYAYVKIKMKTEANKEFGIKASTTTQRIRVKVTSDKVYELRLKAGKTVSGKEIKADQWVASLIGNEAAGEMMKFKSADKKILKISKTKSGELKFTGVAKGETKVTVSYNVPEETLDQLDDLPEEYKEFEALYRAMMDFKMELNVLVE